MTGISPSLNPHPRKQITARAWRQSLGASLTLHVLLLLAVGTLTCWLALSRGKGASAASPPRSVVLSAQPLQRPESHLSRPQAVLLTSATALSGDHQMSCTAVRRLLDGSLRESNKLSVESRFAELEQLTAKLQRVANQETVTQMVEILSNILPATRRQTSPAVIPEQMDSRSFETETGQLDDIWLNAESGNYTAVLIDAHGRRRQVSLDKSTGSHAFRVMQLVKRNPLAERVYRQIVMGLLDELLRGISSGSGKPPTLNLLLP